MGSAYTTLAVHRTDVDMAPRSAGRTSNPNKPGYFNTAFEQTNDHHQYHEEEQKLILLMTMDSFFQVSGDV